MRKKGIKLKVPSRTDKNLTIDMTVNISSLKVKVKKNEMNNGQPIGCDNIGEKLPVLISIAFKVYMNASSRNNEL
jgi:hypothetical protein